MVGVVFDFDGVIANSEPLHEAALRLAARELGLDFTHDQYLTTYIGLDDRGVLEALGRVHGRPLKPQEAAAFHDLKRKAFLRVVQDGGVAAFPGAVELIKASAARGPVAVCSGARMHEIDPILEALGVRSIMAAIVSADDVAFSKPHPESYIVTSRRLGTPPRDLVAIEDTPAGIEAARGAGYRVAAVCHSVPAAELGRADRVFRSIADLTVAQLETLSGQNATRPQGD